MASSKPEPTMQFCSLRMEQGLRRVRLPTSAASMLAPRGLKAGTWMTSEQPECRESRLARYCRDDFSRPGGHGRRRNQRLAQGQVLGTRIIAGSTGSVIAKRRTETGTFIETKKFQRIHTNCPAIVSFEVFTVSYEQKPLAGQSVPRQTEVPLIVRAYC
jgi:hypothetical protein